MYKLKDSLLAFGGQSLLIGVIALVTPHTMLGQGQDGDTVSRTRPVKVVNTPAEPVPVTGAVTGSVSITNTPSVTVANTPSVNVANVPMVRLDPDANAVTVAPRETIAARHWPRHFSRRRHRQDIRPNRHSRILQNPSWCE